MLTNLNTKVLMSLAAIGVAGALIVGATIAFFSDTETSQGNILQAGALDLKIDSEAHYAGLVCTEVADTVPDDVPITPGTVWVLPELGETTRPELIGEECEGTWALKDLNEDQFFDLTDIKPGDEGENTISLHVFDNDAWGQIRVTNIADADVNCTEPETEAGDPECAVFPTPLPSPDVNGELAEKLNFHLWLDQGTTPGFQCYTQTQGQCTDSQEGDNIQQIATEPNTETNVITPGGPDSLIINLAPALAEAWSDASCEDADGHTDYGDCHGLAEDGYLVGSATYYIGVAWELDPLTGNEAQTDSVSADISFDITQHRNQPNPYPSPVAP